MEGLGYGIYERCDAEARMGKKNKQKLEIRFGVGPIAGATLVSSLNSRLTVSKSAAADP